MHTFQASLEAVLAQLCDAEFAQVSKSDQNPADYHDEDGHQRHHHKDGHDHDSNDDDEYDFDIHYIYYIYEANCNDDDEYGMIGNIIIGRSP